MKPFRRRSRRATASVLVFGALMGLLLAAQSSREAAGLAAPQGLVNVLGMRLRLIPEGTFRMGSPEGETGRLGNEGPVHTVRISRSFYMGETEVTVGQFAAFVAATGYRSDAERDTAGGFGIDFETGQVRQEQGITWRAPGFPAFSLEEDHPVVLVSWQDAEAFCRWLSEQEGRVYRLPTEAEWAYAARAGSDAAYAHGDESAGLQARANVADASLRAAAPAMVQAEAWDDGFPFLAPVASFAPNAFGLYDMHGNVWEWCADWYRPGYHVPRTRGVQERVDPQGPRGGSFRAIRGGGWFNPAAQNRSAQRVYFDPRFRYCLLSGFRVVAQADQHALKPSSPSTP